MIVNETKNIVNIPYPPRTSWFLTLRNRCVNGSHCENDSVAVAKIDVDMGHCLNSTCQNIGYCKVFLSFVGLFSGCNCQAGNRGPFCEDSSKQLSHLQWRAIFVVLSNLFFIPSVLICFYYQYFLQSIVFAATMFFSSFYHWCDCYGDYQNCIASYSFLQYCDFFFSVSSFVVTVAMTGSFGNYLSIFVYSLSFIAVAIGVEYDKFSMLLYVTVLLPLILLAITSWIYRSIRSDRMFPSVRDLLIYIPGVILALSAFVSKAILENQQTYEWVHGCWHIAISICPLFFVRARRVRWYCGLRLFDNAFIPLPDGDEVDKESASTEDSVVVIETEQQVVPAGDNAGNITLDMQQ